MGLLRALIKNINLWSQAPEVYLAIKI